MTCRALEHPWLKLAEVPSPPVGAIAWPCPQLPPRGCLGPPSSNTELWAHPSVDLCLEGCISSWWGLQHVAEQVSAYPQPWSAHVCLAELPMAAGTRLEHPTVSLGWGA